MEFTVGQKYTRWEIQEELGGEYQIYLPQVNGRIVAGCFRMRLNPDAPREIQVGDAPKVVKKAETLSKQENKRIPVFIWQKNSPEPVRAWEYQGMYEFSELLDDRQVLAEAEERSKRYDELAYVLQLKAVAGSSS